MARRVAGSSPAEGFQKTGKWSLLIATAESPATICSYGEWLRREGRHVDAAPRTSNGVGPGTGRKASASGVNRRRCDYAQATRGQVSHRNSYDIQPVAVLGLDDVIQPGRSKAYDSVKEHLVRQIQAASMKTLPLRPNAARPRANCETPVRLPISVKTPKISAPNACPTTMITID
jgi:hypothetical protein